MKRLAVIKKKWKWLAVVIVIIIVIIVGIQLTHLNKSQPFKVLITNPITQPIAASVQANGVVAAKDTQSIYVSVPLKVNQVLIKVGDVVKKGQVIITYSPSSQTNAKNAVASDNYDLNSLQSGLTNFQQKEKLAQESLKIAKKNYDNNQAIFKSGGISQDTLDSSQSNYISAQTNLDQVQSDISNQQDLISKQKLTIQNDQFTLDQTVMQTVSPVDGVVTAVTAQPDYYVSMQDPQPLCQIADLSQLIIKAQIPDYQVNQISVGMPVQIISDSGQQFQGTVSTIAAMAQTSTSGQSQNAYVEVDISFNNTQNLLKPNYSVTINIVTAQANNVMTVPATAIVPGNNGQNFVYVLNSQNIVAQKPVQVGI
ncbi:MAG: HlyD family efflux transporter periplasmic adaptor subunit [Fusobacteria bacterium]|nr:HlyD family efflux transporter periplasmic adaptor subunit [Fusobacteriota bacterium]